jgi:hypothetical protein
MQLEPGAGKRIAKEAMRGEDGDMMGELNPLDAMFFRGARVNLQVPIVDPVVTRQCLMFLIDELPGLVARMDRLPDRRSKSLLAETVLKRWNWAFKKKIKG